MYDEYGKPIKKETQYTLLHGVRARVYKGFRERATVYYPNWWGDMPMILYSFFDEHDFSGKTIVPFNTHGGSGFSDSISTIAELEPEAVVNEDGFTESRNNVQDAEPDIIAWLENLGYAK